MTPAQMLLRLQDTDIVELRAQRQIDELPEKAALVEQRKKVRDVSELKAKIDRLIQQYERDLARHEDESALLDSKISSEQTKILSGSVKDPRELQNISRELDGLKRRRDKLDSETLALMEKVEHAGGQREKVAAALEQATAKEAELTEALMTRGAALQREVDAARVERERVCRELDPVLAKQYETARQTKAGLGVGRLEGDRCSACRVALPADKAQSLREGKPDVGVCPMCKRVLVIRVPEA